MKKEGRKEVAQPQFQVAMEGKKLEDYEDGYIIAGDGIYNKSSTDYFTSVTLAPTIDGLPEFKDNIKLSLTMPSIPFRLFYDTWMFFKEVGNQYKSEAIVLLTYTEEAGFNIAIPTQKVGAATLDYETNGCSNIVGTIHSHHTMSAFHSGTDTHDEMHFDGIHITLGRINDQLPDVSCSIMRNGTRFKMDFTDLIDFSAPSDTPYINIKEAMKNVSQIAYTKRDYFKEDPKYYKNTQQTSMEKYPKKDKNTDYDDEWLGGYTSFSQYYRDTL